MSNRREFFKKSFLLGLSATSSALFSQKQIEALEVVGAYAGEQFVLPPLPYSYSALEPFIDEPTMKLHHGKHHQVYVDKLNAALTTYKGEKTLDSLVKNAWQLDASIRNNAGGHYNHSLFWQSLRPNPTSTDNQPETLVMAAITKQFGSFTAFKAEFTKKASSVFGSGWCWLTAKAGQLDIVTSANQDNPLMIEATANTRIILALDVWEHAYYLKYQNQRPQYITAWWNLVNWSFAEMQFQK